MQGDPPWWGIIVISAGATVILGALFFSALAVAVLSAGWIRRTWRRRHG